MRLMVLVFALIAATALAGTVTFVASASQADAAHDELAIKPAWQNEAAFPDGTIPFEGIEADLDGNASALAASAWDTTLATR